MQENYASFMNKIFMPAEEIYKITGSFQPALR